MAVFSLGRDYVGQAGKAIKVEGGVAIVHGKRIRLDPVKDGFSRVTVNAVGRDGTILINRADVEGPVWTLRDFIVHGTRETMVMAYGEPAFINDYIDAHNYAGSYYARGDNDGIHSASFPPFIYTVVHGRYRPIGQGNLQSWFPGKEVVAGVPIDDLGNIAYYESPSVTHTYVFDAGRTYDLGAVAFKLRLPDGRSLFRKFGQLWIWERGGLTPWATLPRGWELAFAGSSDDLVVRNGTTLGILRGQILTPLRLDKKWNDAIVDCSAGAVGLDGTVSFVIESATDRRQFTFRPVGRG